MIESRSLDFEICFKSHGPSLGRLSSQVCTCWCVLAEATRGVPGIQKKLGKDLQVCDQVSGV